MGKSFIALSVAIVATPVLAAEGMWLPSQTRAIAPELRAAGLALDPNKLGDLSIAPLNAIVSLGNCSASFVSPQGLVVSNHHCVYGSLQYAATTAHDYLRDGFYAKQLKDEIPAAPGTRIYVIEELRDVTRAMTVGLSDKMSGLVRQRRIDANRSALVAECETRPNRRCDVRAYFGGAAYYLQRQLEIRDVRLVYAPAGGIGNFGGEIDNWQWPRHTGDFGFYRAYVAPDGSSRAYDKANVPYRPSAWLRMATDDLKDGDFVMVAGFPGTSERLRTATEAAFYYRDYYPLQQRLLADYSDAIGRVTAGDADASIKYAAIRKGADNYKKKLLGQMAGADAIDLETREAIDEQAYRDWIAADPRGRARYAAAATALDPLVQEADRRELAELRRALLTRAQLLSSARALYRWSRERAKPDDNREDGYQERDRQLLVDRLTQTDRRFVPKVDRALFETALAEYRQIDASYRYNALLAKLDQIGLDRLYADTKLGTVTGRIAWLDKPPAAFEQSTDPFIQLAVAMAPEELEAEKRDKDLAGRLQPVRSAYNEGLIAFASAHGRTLYPDANSSLRFTYGKVSGKVVDGAGWKPFTTAEGFAAKHSGKAPFDAPAPALALIRDRDYAHYASPTLGTLPVDFLSTVDITNGNSGSATMNARGEFVGLAFDGTLEGVISDWHYDPAINRTIHVDARFMLWVMDKVDNATRLLTEMGVPADESKPRSGRD